MLLVEDDLFYNRMFDVLDGDGDGAIGWDEFLRSLCCLTLGDRFALAELLFKVHTVLAACHLQQHVHLPCQIRPELATTPPVLSASDLQVYDTHGRGAVSKREFEVFFLSSMRLDPTAALPDMFREYVDRVFDRIDGDRDGDVTLDDVLTFLKENPGEQDVYSLFGRSMACSHSQPV